MVFMRLAVFYCDPFHCSPFNLTTGATPRGACLAKDEEDSLVQLRAVESALARLGHDVLSVALNIESPERAIEELKGFAADCVFNLVEETAGHSDLNHLAAFLLESIGLCHTGCSAKALLLTGDKVLCKRLFRASGLPTPDWITEEEAMLGNVRAGDRYLLKPRAQDASLGIDEDRLMIFASVEEGRQAILAHSHAVPGGFFAEQYVDGREFNISLIEIGGEPKVLPAAEIRFDAYPSEKPKVVGYRAKWAEGSFEYENTPRSFVFPGSDRELILQLEQLSLRCWRLFSLSGYARVDFRVSTDGQPYILEINANPGIAPDAGFVAAAAEQGMSYDEVIAQIVESAIFKRELS